MRHVLEGSVRTDGDRVRITAQLIDTEDSTHLWSQTYDRDYSAENLFDIQSQVARSIANHLRITLTEPEDARLVTAPTENTEAYAAYLLGRDRLRDRKGALVLGVLLRNSGGKGQGRLLSRHPTRPQGRGAGGSRRAVRPCRQAGSGLRRRLFGPGGCVSSSLHLQRRPRSPHLSAQ